MTTETDLAAEDRAYYAVFASEVLRDMIRANAFAQCLAEQIEPLKSTPSLPEKLRHAYTEMHQHLSDVAALADQVGKRYRFFEAMLDIPKHEPDSSEELVNAVVAGIRRLDAVEGRIRHSFDELRDRLKEPNRSTSEWEDVSIEAIVTLYLEPSPERKIYSELLEAVYFRPADSFEEFLDHDKFTTCMIGDGDNWNHQFQPDHPLGSIRYGYLTHSFIEDGHLPWFMLAQIRDIEVEWHIRGERIYRFSE